MTDKKYEKKTTTMNGRAKAVFSSATVTDDDMKKNTQTHIQYAVIRNCLRIEASAK